MRCPISNGPVGKAGCTCDPTMKRVAARIHTLPQVWNQSSNPIIRVINGKNFRAMLKESGITKISHRILVIIRIRDKTIKTI